MCLIRGYWNLAAVLAAALIGPPAACLAADAVPDVGDKVLHVHDLSGDGRTPPRKLLDLRGFHLEHDIKNDGAIALAHRDGALHIQAREQSFGIMLHEEDIHGAGRLRLHWGISDYPEGAAYEHGVDNEAIMVYVFFGHEKFSSGSMFVPDAPYFIGFYLCRDGTDELEVAYEGHYYEKSGRYICVAHPEEGRKVVTEIDFHEEFRKSFDLDRAPSISAVSVEVDTTDSANDGHAAAFIERLEFLP